MKVLLGLLLLAAGAWLIYGVLNHPAGPFGANTGTYNYKTPQDQGDSGVNKRTPIPPGTAGTVAKPQ